MMNRVFLTTPALKMPTLLKVNVWLWRQHLLGVMQIPVVVFHVRYLLILVSLLKLSQSIAHCIILCVDHLQKCQLVFHPGVHQVCHQACPRRYHFRAHISLQAWYHQAFLRHYPAIHQQAVQALLQVYSLCRIQSHYRALLHRFYIILLFQSHSLYHTICCSEQRYL